MAKGRRLTTSRSERLLGSYSYVNGKVTSEDTELGEEDVWSMVDDVADRSDDGNKVSNDNSHDDWSPRAGTEINRSVTVRRRPRIPKNDSHVGGLSLAFEDSSDKSTSASRIVHQSRGHENSVSSSPRQMATSAPVNVPDWSKIYRVDSVESLNDFGQVYDDRESEMVPPHEYLAREYAGSKKNGGASVFEGVGRTLKGRDLRRVRDAVWSQTGFDG